MSELDLILNNIVKVEYVYTKMCVRVYFIKFKDDSMLELANDRIFNYVLSRTPGFAEDVSLVELQRIDFSRLIGINTILRA